MLKQIISFISASLSGPNIRPTCDPDGVSGGAGEPAAAGDRPAPGLPLGQDQGVPLHHPAPTHTRGDAILAHQGPRQGEREHKPKILFCCLLVA